MFLFDIGVNILVTLFMYFLKGEKIKVVSLFDSTYQ